MRIGILGGTFNPPQMGHLILAQEVLDILKLNKVFFIPTNISPHKESDAPANLRFDMVKLATSGNSCFEVLDLEIKRGGVSYTIDTIKELKERYPEDEFYLIIGSDLANEFFSWKDYQEIKRQVKIAVVYRENFPLKAQDDFNLLDITHMSISSSEIRRLIKEEKSIKYLVPDRVIEYISKHKLYK